MASYVPAPPPGAGAPLSAPAAPGRSAELVPNAQELRLGELLTREPGQRRASLTYSPVLARVAREKAWDMGRRGYFDHVDPDGLGANTLAARAGYALPAHYDLRPAGNNIESLGVAYATAESMWRTWMGSTAHRAHLLGLGPHFAEQTEYGVGYAFVPGSRRAHYWVVLIARPGGAAARAEAGRTGS